MVSIAQNNGTYRVCAARPARPARQTERHPSAASEVTQARESSLCPRPADHIARRHCDTDASAACVIRRNVSMKSMIWDPV